MILVYILLGAGLCIGLALLLEKFVPVKLNPLVSLVLWAVIAFIGFKLYGAINGPIEFNKVRDARYINVIKNLKDIRAAELAHQEISGDFTGSFDSLVMFIDTAKFAIIQRRDTSYADVEKNKAYGIDEGYFIEEILIDTLGFTSVKDSLYQGSDRYKQMMFVPGVDNQKFDLKAGKLEKNGTVYSVFEASVAKDIILADQDKDMVAQEKQTVSVDGVNGTHIKVGSMNDINTSGNWPKLFDSAKEN